MEIQVALPVPLRMWMCIVGTGIMVDHNKSTHFRSTIREKYDIHNKLSQEVTTHIKVLFSTYTVQEAVSYPYNKPKRNP